MAQKNLNKIAQIYLSHLPLFASLWRLPPQCLLVILKSQKLNIDTFCSDSELQILRKFTTLYLSGFAQIALFPARTISNRHKKLFGKILEFHREFVENHFLISKALLISRIGQKIVRRIGIMDRPQFSKDRKLLSRFSVKCQLAFIFTPGCTSIFTIIFFR